MRLWGRHMLLAAATATAGLALVVGSASGAPPPAEFIDPTGDAGPGPDITKVTVSLDDAGLLTFRIEMPNRPTLGATQFNSLEIDTDANSATGNKTGADVILTGFSAGAGMGRWNGTEFGDPTVPASLRHSYSGGAATITISRTDLGLTTDTLRFWVGVTDNLDDPANFDPAPEVGLYTYALATKPAIKSILVPATVLLPTAGKVVSARGIQIRLTTDEIVRPESMTCTLKLAGKAVKPLAGGCKWRIPASAKGKRGTLAITLSYQGETMSQSYPVRVR
jgi:hypothetical protein